MQKRVIFNMLRSLMPLVVAALVWTGSQWGSAKHSERTPHGWNDMLVTSQISLPRLPDIVNDRSTSPRRRSPRHAGPLEPPDEPLPLPDELESPATDQEASLAALRRYSPSLGDFSVCCPAGEELTSPRAGARRDGSLAILYTDDTFQQMFFERSCQPRSDAEDSLVERRMRRRYKCVQQYSHSYAVYNVNGTKVLDYIRIRSGCKCEVKNKAKRKRRRP